MALASLIFTAVIDKLTPGTGWERLPLHALGTVVLFVLTMLAIGAYARMARKSELALKKENDAFPSVETSNP